MTDVEKIRVAAELLHHAQGRRIQVWIDGDVIQIRRPGEGQPQVRSWPYAKWLLRMLREDEALDRKAEDVWLRYACGPQISSGAWRSLWMVGKEKV